MLIQTLCRSQTPLDIRRGYYKRSRCRFPRCVGASSVPRQYFRDVGRGFARPAKGATVSAVAARELDRAEDIRDGGTALIPHTGDYRETGRSR